MNRNDCPEGSSCTLHKDDHGMFFFLKRSLGELTASGIFPSSCTTMSGSFSFMLYARAHDFD